MTAQAKRAIDFDHLDAYTGGDTDLVHEVLRLFRGQVSMLVESLAATEDAKTWRETAHGIKGAARGIGAWAAADAAAVIEKCDFADREGRLKALGALSDAFSAVNAEIDAELAKT